MSDELRTAALAALIESLDIPDSAYEEAQRRYKDLAQWLQDEVKAKSSRFEPSISPQGSFRLGTVIKPWKREDYDLDLTCRLQKGLTTQTCTQEQLKTLIGQDLEAYRIERRIQEKPEEKHRCWRLVYQDHLQFHIDTVPCIPHTENVRTHLQKRITEAGLSALLARDVASFAVAITDDRHQSYRYVTDDWFGSNPEGYALWFESRMRLGDVFLAARAIEAKVRTISELPVFQWKTPLQKVVQILKRHRDVMYENDSESKPSSIIITTLAAAAYKGEHELTSALENIVNSLELDRNTPRVPNPVYPQEDFTDKWKTADGRRLRLKENFFVWADQAKRDLRLILRPSQQDHTADLLKKRFGARMSDEVGEIIPGAERTSSPVIHVIRDTPPKPWCQ